MSLWYLLILIAAIGVGLYVVNRFVPMQSTVKWILNAVVVLILVFTLLEAFGVIDVLKTVHVGKAR